MIDRILELKPNGGHVRVIFASFPASHANSNRTALIDGSERLSDHLSARFGLNGIAIVVLGLQGSELK